ncbi:hypothetical protein WN51_08764 [Melipona quadrifasciata]|uniref:Uncharacterized protein n=1 Tax=Melipona quadrifasciata TaxID=166423 RepID=A0A0M8ZQT2_9HYME|nr:hypothetical protein WN51_08764 [Melipona quadrifasciata]
MKNAHPIITAAPSSSCLVDPDSSSSSEPAEPIIRLRLDKPLHWEWELTTSADALPVVQLLDKDGRLLVETTGRTAQRARGSFREGLRTHEEFPTTGGPSAAASSSFSSSSTPSTVVLAAPRNRNADGFSTKFGTVRFGYEPRKSKSDVTVKEKRKKRKNRHSSGGSEREGEERASLGRRYSVGDYLRRQIIDDLTNESYARRSPEEVARERCRKVKAYLRSRSETLPRLVHVEEEEPDRNWRSSVDANDEDRIRSERIKDGFARLREAIGKRGELGDAPDGARFEPVPNDANVGNCRRIGKEELERVRSFLRTKIQERMELERCNVPPAWPTKGRGIQKRYSDCRRPEDPRGYRTRKVRSETSIVRFDPEILEKDRQKGSGGGRQVERERCPGAGRSRSKDSFGQKACRQRSRSEAILEAAETSATNRSGRQWAETRETAEKRKLYRKTRSDVLLGQMAGSLDSEQENPPRRARSQDTVDESWREYKERKKHERLRRESETAREVKEEDFMSKPRWKDLQTALCSSTSNCRICQNLQNCANPSPSQQKQGISPENRGSSLADESRAKFEDSCAFGASNDSANERPSTSLQENYLVVDKKPNAAKARASSHDTDSSNVNSPDCGYSTIPKKTFNDYKELYARSNVKKSDTFKIVDGSEELPSLEEDTEERSEDSNHDGESADRFGCPSQHGGVLTNKSNEDIARDYFKRVYELLKRRQEEARKMAEKKQEMAGCDDSSSSNYTEKVQKRRLRRKKKERDTQGKKRIALMLCQSVWNAEARCFLSVVEILSHGCSCIVTLTRTSETIFNY